MGKYKKLVRDRIPEIIEGNGEKPHTRILNDGEFKAELIKKLYEEAREVMEAEDREGLIKELSDVEEVILGILKSQNIKRSEIEQVRKERKAKRGGFEKKIFLESVE